SGRRLHLAIPQPPRVDAGDIPEHVGLDAEAVQGGLEAGVDLFRTQSARRVDVGEAGDGDMLEQHGGDQKTKETRQDTGFKSPTHRAGSWIGGAVQRQRSPSRLGRACLAPSLAEQKPGATASSALAAATP